MIYEIMANMFFNSEDEAIDFFGDCQKALGKSVVVHPDEPQAGKPCIQLIKCFHDETPTKPCEVVECLTSS